MEYLDRATPITGYCYREHLAIPSRLRVFRQLCEAVDHVHSKAILHCDLKPSNVLIARANGAPECKLIDFGAAISCPPKSEAALLTNKRSRTVIGTPEYMSPEQAGVPGQPLGPWTDIYSLGVMLYELLTGQRPFAATPRRALMSNPVGTPRAVFKRDAFLESIVRRAMGPDRNSRYASVSELLDSLDHWLLLTTHQTDWHK